MGLRKNIQKVKTCRFFIYTILYIVEVLARLFRERKLVGAQTPHLRRNHCRPLRKAQRPPGQVSEIKEQEEFQNIKKIANGTKKTFDTTLGHFLRSMPVYILEKKKWR